MIAYVYMLRCSDGSLYVGSTRLLQERVHQHQMGMGANYTRSRLPVELVWHEEHENPSHAFAREKQVQNWSRAKRLALIAGDYEGLPALAKKDFSRPGTADGSGPGDLTP
ncbi:putative endonuclease [Nocardioides exalbidus]|uniref:Putative endonuclease n=1 Tax=Nocardioides exalbidus TaxID=402596 RepID=A0A1H4M9L1_9ACTN|nr:GIY-YIG nuclease family protein [Nocardioides exalbidus]SEB79780.1 putative endonuclease [Nocardioides exalbidus]